MRGEYTRCPWHGGGGVGTCLYRNPGVQKHPENTVGSWKGSVAFIWHALGSCHRVFPGQYYQLIQNLN